MDPSKAHHQILMVCHMTRPEALPLFFQSMILNNRKRLPTPGPTNAFETGRIVSLDLHNLTSRVTRPFLGDVRRLQLNDWCLTKRLVSRLSSLESVEIGSFRQRDTEARTMFLQPHTYPTFGDRFAILRFKCDYSIRLDEDGIDSDILYDSLWGLSVMMHMTLLKCYNYRFEVS